VRVENWKAGKTSRITRERPRSLNVSTSAIGAPAVGGDEFGNLVDGLRLDTEVTVRREGIATKRN
jgi:hypothetical protein